MGSSAGGRRDGQGGQSRFGQTPFVQTRSTSVRVTGRHGDVFRAEVYRCVNVTTDPELRDALRSGALYEVDAPDGGEPYRLALPLCYHDEDAQLFALVLPEALRHREFALRAELLDELDQVDGPLPDYIRQFDTVVGVDGLAELEARAARPADAAEANDELVADGGQPASTVVSEPPQPSEDVRAELEAAWQELEEERDQLAQERQQLDEVRERIDRERARMDEVEDEIARERDEIREMRSEIEAMKLNLEQKQLRMEQGAPESNAEESTQVVTDDQFIEVVDDDDASEANPDQPGRAEPAGAEPHEATELIESPYHDQQEPAELTEEEVNRADDALAPQTFASDAWRSVEVVDGHVLASAKLPDAVITAFEDAPTRSFFVQYDHEGGYPLLGLLFAALDDDEQATETVGWALDVANADHEIVLDRLDGSVELRVALYDGADKLAAVYEIAAPLHDNVDWIRNRAEHVLAEEDVDLGSFDDAANRWQAADFERLGAMRHNFRHDSFEEATTPGELKLATGIVGYWSTPEKYEYLVANRSFPLDQFEAIQKRVVRRAVQHGLYLNAPLRRVAVEAGLAADEIELVERLVAEFAEISVGLRDNDLDPIQEWENWEDLIELAEDVGVTIDPDVLELAEASLKRAQDFQETDLPDDAGAALGAEPSQPQPAGGHHGEYEVDNLVVARRSESTGVTYFLPDDAVLDTFDDLASMARDDLELLLDDAKGRLEAAQMLIERFGAEGAELALHGAENMTATEVAALARFLETKAEGLEAELVRCVESGGPSATYVAARALVSIRSTPAIPTLLDAYRDEKRRGDKQALARALAQYGDKLLPPLKRAIKKDGHDDALVTLLREMERQHDGLLAELAKDRSKKVRTAASAARD